MSYNSSGNRSPQQAKDSILDWDLIDGAEGEGVEVEAWIGALPPSPPRERFAENASLVKSWLNGQPWNDMAIGFESASRPSPQDLLMARAEIGGDPSGSGGFTFRSFKENAFIDAMESVAWLDQHAARLEEAPREPAADRDREIRELLKSDMRAFVKLLDLTVVEKHKQIQAAILDVNSSFGSMQGPALASAATAVLRQALDDDRPAEKLEQVLFAIAGGKTIVVQDPCDVTQAFDAATRILEINGSIPGKYVPGPELLAVMENAKRIHQYLAKDYQGDDWQATLPRGGLSPDQKISFQDLMIQAVHLSHECATGLLPSAISESLLMMRFGQAYRAGIREDVVFRSIEEAFYTDPLTAIEDYPRICQEICEKRDGSPSPEF